MNIVILDDQELFKEGLHYLLQAIDPNICLFQASNIQQAQAIVEEHSDIALMLIDLDMPVNDGFVALELFTRLFATMPCVILSASTQRSDVIRALDEGAMGFISKQTKGPALLNALKLILSGEIYVPYGIMYAERRTNRDDDIAFTTRQLQVMALVRQGCLNKVIAHRLELAESTIKMHLSAIFEKLKVHNRTAAIKEINKLNITLPKLD